MQNFQYIDNIDDLCLLSHHGKTILAEFKYFIVLCTLFFNLEQVPKTPFWLILPLHEQNSFLKAQKKNLQPQPVEKYIENPFYNSIN